MAARIYRSVWNKLTNPVLIAPLVTFRIVFGLLMFVSMMRFWWNGWICSLYVHPKFHFTYWGFEWVKPLGDVSMHLIFASIAAAALFMALGFLYRIASIWFFIGFLYIELIDVATYLNHYYLVSLVAFLLIWLPAGRNYSLDVLLWPKSRITMVPFACVALLRFQMAIVYIFAGFAKLNTDWLFEAQPLSMWLPAKSHLPVVGPYMYHSYTAYLFSWFGAIYDLFIVFFLLNRKTRPVAYAFVIIFHACTALFFPSIGIFPYIMMTSSLIFFSGPFHEKILGFLPVYKGKRSFTGEIKENYEYGISNVLPFLIGLYVTAQVLIPLRFMLYPGHLFWNEAGYRFSWRVMLMEKSGAAYFTVKPQTGSATYSVNNPEFLSVLQEKMMSTQPDLILQYAHFLADEYEKRGIEDPVVNAEIYVSLNGTHSTLFVDPAVDLGKEEFSWKHYSWVLPYKQ